MPTRLGQFQRRYTDTRANSSRVKLAQETERSPLHIGPPFGGYTPDLTNSTAEAADGRDVSTLFERGGVLQVPDGYAKIDSTRLPLGDATPPATTGNPICGLFQSLETGTSLFPRRLAFTSGTNDSTDPGRVYELDDSTGQWEHKAYGNAVVDTTRQLTGDATNPEKVLFDYAFFPPVGSGICVFTNNVDEIMRFPDADTNEYDIFDTSAIYIAKSVEASEDRVLALNVSVAGTRHRARLIWTDKGASASFDTSSAAAGFADFFDIKGQGLKVMNLGKLVALYFDTGVVVLERTGINVDPWRRFFTSHGRGLLSTHSVVDLGSGVHFGLFTDGWFYLDANGRWTEAGLRRIEDVPYHKWHRTFYELLDWENRDRVVCAFDPVNRMVRVAFPTKGFSSPNAVWNYDLLNDTVWPDEQYGASFPNIWGTYRDIFQTGETWSTITSTWPAEGRGWDDMEPTRGRDRLIHGTTAGNVFRHAPDTVTRDGATPTYRYRSHQFNLRRMDQEKTGRKLILSYLREQNASGQDPPPVLAELGANSGQRAQRNIPVTKGSPNTAQSDFVSGQVSGTALDWGISGSAPVKVTAVQMQITGHDGQMRARDSDGD